MTVVIRLELMGEPRTGLWCDDCSLPARWEVDMALTSGDDLLSLAPYSRCDNGCDDVEVTMEGQA